VLDYGLLQNDSKANWGRRTIAVIGHRCRWYGDGFRADIVIIDDSIRGRAEAESMLARAHLWDWFTADLLTGLKPRGAVVLIATL
jgi:hypothetical protein